MRSLPLGGEGARRADEVAGKEYDMKVVLASKNKHKLVEISKITEKFGFELVLESDVGVDIDVEETGTTFEENSFLKANAVMQATGLPALADDSGIAVDALNGEPGIYSARYGFDETLDDAGRVKLLLHNMEQEFDVFGQVARGSLSGVTGWLREHVHQYGQLLEPAAIVKNACGEFDPHYYLDYLTRKYTELYNL